MCAYDARFSTEQPCFSAVEHMLDALSSELTYSLHVVMINKHHLWTPAVEPLSSHVAATLQRVKEILKISTGATAINELLGGGIETKSITEIYGEYRWVISHQLAHKGLSCTDQ